MHIHIQSSSPEYQRLSGSRHPVTTRALTALFARIGAFVVLAFLAIIDVSPAQAQSVAFKQAVATAAAKDRDILAFYQSRGFKPIWTGNRDRQRRRALVDAFSKAPNHGLPRGRYDAIKVKRSLAGLKSAKARGTLEVEITQKFLQYVNDVQSGILEPRRVDKNMTLKPPRRDRLKTLQAFSKSSPAAFIGALPPKNPDYGRLMKEKIRIERVIKKGGWGKPVAAKKLKPGQNGKSVVALRKRLTAMGYNRLGLSPDYNETLIAAVKLFQQDHGLNTDGVAGATTMAAINVQPDQRLMQVVIGLERLRWLNKPLGKRHILVSEADFRVTVFDNAKPTFTSRVVVGKAGRWRTPEFEKAMTHMVVNPSWFVPGSIAGGEYLPLLKKNASALNRQGIELRNASGQRVDPTTIDFSQYSKNNFPFSMKQPPSSGNALGRVKFMFPNRHAIYLHDTPAKRLFSKDIRTFSHGCVRVQKPLELAYVLLSKQSANPKALFDKTLASGKETRIDLKSPVPIYLVYRTAWVAPNGRPNYRADSYGVDKKLFAALAKAGVVLSVPQG